MERSAFHPRRVDRYRSRRAYAARTLKCTGLLRRATRTAAPDNFAVQRRRVMLGDHPTSFYERIVWRYESIVHTKSWGTEDHDNYQINVFVHKLSVQ